MKFYSVFFSILLAIVLPITANAAEKTYNKIVFFGDSLTDNGNLYRWDFKLVPKSPPYYEGRFTNGSTWAEFVQAHNVENNIVSQNYAVGGETAYFHNPFNGYLPYSLSESINNYLFRTTFQDKSHTLFIIWVGANDYLNGAANVDEATTNVVQAIKNNIEKLITRGGRKFLVLNLPDLSKTPQASTNDLKENLHALSLFNNEKLDELVSNLQQIHSDIEIRLYDMNTFFNNLLEYPDVFNSQYQTHITNTTSSCWTGGYTVEQIRGQRDRIASELIQTLQQSDTQIDPKQLANFIVSSPDLAIAYKVGSNYMAGEVPCNNPDEYVFWDHLHPTAVMHRVFGNLLADYIDKTFV